VDVVDAKIHDLCCEMSKAESKQILLATDEVDLRDQSEESDVGKGSGKNL